MGPKIEPKHFLLKLFGRFRDIPAKSRDIPLKKFDSLGFEGHTELFGPHPFTWQTPTPPENIRTQKFRFGFFPSACMRRTLEVLGSTVPPKPLAAILSFSGVDPKQAEKPISKDVLHIIQITSSRDSYAEMVDRHTRPQPWI